MRALLTLQPAQPTATITLDDLPGAQLEEQQLPLTDDAREAIGGKTLNLGLVPYFDTPQRTLTPGTPPAETQNLLDYQLPSIPTSGGLPTNPADRVPAYQTLTTSEVPIDPGGDSDHAAAC